MFISGIYPRALPSLIYTNAFIFSVSTSHVFSYLFLPRFLPNRHLSSAVSPLAFVIPPNLHDLLQLRDITCLLSIIHGIRFDVNILMNLLMKLPTRGSPTP